MAKSGAVVGPLLCALPSSAGKLNVHNMRNTVDSALNSLDSIATAAVNLLSSSTGAKVSDKEERLRERRSQIAAASRKSRAKRKREHSVLKEENELLLLEVSALRKRLRTYAQSAATDGSSGSTKVTGNTPSKTMVSGAAHTSSRDMNMSSSANAPLKKKLASRYSSESLKVEEAKLTREAKSEAQKEIFERVKAVISPDLRAKLTAEPEVESSEKSPKKGSSTLEETLSDAREALEPAMKETPVLGEILDFFHKQLEEYFAFLKSDVVGHFGSNFSQHKREALLDLRLRFLSP